MKKRILSLALALCMALPLLVACNGNGGTTAPTTTPDVTTVPVYNPATAEDLFDRLSTFTYKGLTVDLAAYYAENVPPQDVARGEIDDEKIEDYIAYLLMNAKKLANEKQTSAIIQRAYSISGDSTIEQ